MQLSKTIRWLCLLLCCYATTLYAASSVLNNTPYQVCFTPGGHCTALIIHAIDNAKHTIDMQAYSFTSKPILKALLRAHKRGVKVLALLDRSNVNERYSVMLALQNAGIHFLIDYRPRIAHNKTIIIDSSTVETGSFNFSYSAQHRNTENVLIIHNHQLAKQYLQNFERRRKDSISLARYCKLSHKCHITMPLSPGLELGWSSHASTRH